MWLVTVCGAAVILNDGTESTRPSIKKIKYYLRRLNHYRGNSYPRRQVKWLLKAGMENEIIDLCLRKKFFKALELLLPYRNNLSEINVKYKSAAILKPLLGINEQATWDYFFLEDRLKMVHDSASHSFKVRDNWSGENSIGTFHYELLAEVLVHATISHRKKYDREIVLKVLHYTREDQLFMKWPIKNLPCQCFLISIHFFSLTLGLLYPLIPHCYN